MNPFTVTSTVGVGGGRAGRTRSKALSTFGTKAGRPRSIIGATVVGAAIGGGDGDGGTAACGGAFAVITADDFG